jgi:transposase
MWTLPPLEITDEERAELERRVRAKTSTQRQAQRAKVILLAADGVPSRRIAKAVGIHENYVGVWRRRFASERLAGLEDRPRSGRPRKYGHDARLRIVATATSSKPQWASHWSHALLANYLSDLGISASQVGRILAGLDIKPHQVRSWLSRPDDPTFWERAADVCGLYLSRPTSALVLSVDEKTAIPARSRKHPTKRVTPGKPERQEFEYRRHGTACLMAALNVHTGEVLGKDAVRNDSASFISFLDEIDAYTPADLDIHLCWTTAPRTSPRRPRRGWPPIPASTSITRPSTPAGSTRSSCSSRSSAAGCCGEASSTPATISSGASWGSSRTTTARPSRSAGPTTARP